MTPRTSPTRSPTEPHISEARRDLRQTNTFLQPSLVSKLYSASSSVSFLLLPSFRLIHISEADDRGWEICELVDEISWTNSRGQGFQSYKRFRRRDFVDKVL
ncbi:hypothetical protein YC2023_042649 [Brassica napus]